MSKKIFSESEVTTIIKRASEIQEREMPSYASGITMEELQRIANECGIGEAALMAAMTQPEQDTKTSFLNLVEVHERVFDGEVDMSRLDEVVEALGDGVRVNTMQTLGRTVKAQVVSGTVFGTLELTARNGRTKLRFRQTPFVAYFAGLHLPLILSVVAMANLFAFKMWAAGLAALIALLGVGFTLFYMFANMGKKKARTLVEKMSNRVSDLITEQQQKSQSLTSSPTSVEKDVEQRLSQGS